MRTVTPRRLAVPALAALLVVAGCGDDGGDDEAGDVTSTTSAPAEADGSDEATTTTAADDAVTTDAGGSTTTVAGDEDGDAAAPPDTAAGQEGTGAPDQEAPDTSWDLDATRYRGEDGTRIAYPCPPDGELGPVWGTGTYTDDSSVCSAAVHAGLINPVEGGRVVIEIGPGEESYEGSEANGVTSEDYDGWPGSFTFPTA